MNKEITSEELEKKIEDFRNKLKNPKTTMTDEKLEELKSKVLESLSMDRQKVITAEPFIGGMMMRFELVPIRDYRCSTAQTDGSRIYFDIAFYKSLTPEERQFVLAHEVWHNVFLHFQRKQGRESMAWNVATDCEINYMLKNEGFFKSPPMLCYPEKEDEGKSAEEIYERIMKKAKKKQPYGNNTEGDGGGSSDSSGKSSNDNSNGNSKNKKNGLKGQFDKHIEDDSDDDNGGSLPSDEWGEKGEDPSYTPRIDQDAAERIREAVVSEAQKYERLRGKLPGGLESVINKFRKAEISWREKLAQFVTSCIGDKRQWLPPSRRHVWQDLYLQSRRGERIQVICTIDTSGSTTADLPKFVTELVSLLNTFGNYDLTLIQCDADVQSVETYDGCNPFPFEDLEKIKWKGFGGSDLNPAFDEIVKRDIEASVHVVFTDGYIGVPEKNPLNCPTLFVLTSDGDEKLCDWGEKIRFKEKRTNEDY